MQFQIDNYTVTFSAEAKVYTREHVGTHYETAVESIAKHKARQKPHHPGIVVAERVAECVTKSDRGGKPHAQAAAPADADRPEAPKASVAPSDAKPDRSPAPVPPADEWPRYVLTAQLTRYDSRTHGCWWDEGRTGCPTTALAFDIDSRLKLSGAREITPTEAAAWLRANGHAAEADKVEPARGEDSWRVWKLTGCHYVCFALHRIDAGTKGYREDRRNGWELADELVTDFTHDREYYTELHGPEREAVINSFKASAAREAK